MLPHLNRACFRRHPEWAWPHLTPLLLGQGDAFIALHSLPHIQTPNRSEHDRVNVYFRVRRARPENPLESATSASWHGSDHPDRPRGYGNYEEEFLDTSAAPDYDAFAYSIEKLCDHWSEWDGVRELAAEERRARQRL